MMTLLRFLASLRLTVTLFALSMFLIFAGTLAQVQLGIWEVVDGYFRSFWAWVPLSIFLPESMSVPGGFYFPGGFILGGLLVANLLAAHLIRFKITDDVGDLIIGGIGTAVGVGILIIAPAASSWPQWTVAFEKVLGKSILGNFWPMLVMITLGVLILIPPSYLLYKKRAGVVLLHAGIVVLLLGELVTAVAADEANMLIEEGSYANYKYDLRSFEFAVIDPTDPNVDRVTVVPAALLEHRDKPLQDDRLPFVVDVREWMPNSQMIDLRAQPAMPAAQQVWRRAAKKREQMDAVHAGSVAALLEVDKAAGVEGAKVDAAGAYLTLSTRDGEDLGTYMLHVTLERGQPVEIDGRTYLLSLRFKRTYLPYRIHLIDFRHDKYVGTDKPRNFSSKVTIDDPRTGENRQALIKMNAPMRYDEQTFYQSAFLPGDTATILQVVRNPGWALPYIACLLVTGGMVAHFGHSLTRFIQRDREDAAYLGRLVMRIARVFGGGAS